MKRGLVRDAALYLAAVLALGTIANVVGGRDVPWWGQGQQPPQPGVDFQWIDAASVEALRTSLPTVVILDTRTPAAFAAGHVEGALSLPYTELGRRLTPEVLARLGSADAVIVYGETPDADTEQLFAQELHVRGVPPPHIMAGGFPAWEASALPTAEGEP